jgi:hypothetical protein
VNQAKQMLRVYTSYQGRHTWAEAVLGAAHALPTLPHPLPDLDSLQCPRPKNEDGLHLEA